MVFKREVAAIINDRLYLASLGILPVVMMLFFTIFFYRGSIDNLPVTVIDNDHTSMSRKLISMVDATRGIAITSRQASVIDAQRMLIEGSVYGYMVIPNGFEEAIFGGQQTSVDVAISGANLSAAGVIRRDAQQAIMTLSSGIAISQLESRGMSEYKAIIDVMPINTLTHIVANPYLNYGYYLAPIFMFVGIVVFTMLLSIYAIGRELRYATASGWLTAASNSLTAAIIGKLLPITMVMFAIMGLAFLLLTTIMGMELMGSITTLMLVSLLLILAYQAIAVVMVTITANMRLALSLGGGYAVMAFTFSGITFPTMAMYGIARSLSYIFPFTYYSKFFISYTLIGADISYSHDDILMIILFIFIIALAWRRLNRVVRDRRYWGRD